MTVPPDNESRPPGGKGGDHDAANVTTIVTCAGDDDRELAAQLRRRRESAWRLPPLESGHRDPLDGLARLPIGPAQECHGAERGPESWQPCCRSAGAA